MGFTLRIAESSFATNDLHGVGGRGAAFQHKPRQKKTPIGKIS